MDIPANVPDDQLMRVHPTQLYETGMSLIIWAVGLWMLKRGARPGATALTVLALLAVERLLVEFLRAKDDRFFGVFTLAQMISIGLLLLFAGIAWYRRGRLQARAA